MQYLLLIYNDASKLKSLTPAGHEAMAKGYRAWLESMTERGSLRATGNWPAVITTVRVDEGKTLTTDGPFAEAREGVGGFCVIEARDMSEAVEMASGLPSAAIGGVEVRPLLPSPASNDR
jgi:hypothetical protein